MLSSLFMSLTSSYPRLRDALPEETETDIVKWREQIHTLMEALEDDRIRRLKEDIANQMEVNPDFSFKHLEDMAFASKPVVSKLCIPEGATDFGTAQSFNFEEVIHLRKQHETAEARSAITYRYRHALEEDNLGSLADVSKPAADNSESASAPDSAKLKAGIVHEITRVVSTSLTSCTRQGASGIERMARWVTLGIHLTMQDSGKGTTSAMPPPEGPTASPLNNPQLTSTSIKQVSGRTRYLPLEQGIRVPFSLMSGGLSASRPLKRGSWVIAVFCEHLYFGVGMCY